MPTTEFDASLEIILDTLPAEHTGPQRRKNSLTRADGEVMINLIKVITSHQGCSIGLSNKQAESLRDTPAEAFDDMNDMVRERKRMIYAIGVLALTLLGFIGEQIFTKVHWVKAWDSITKQ